MTDVNWPLIGPMGPEGAFMNCAQSGFGTMAACASGELCATWVAGAPATQVAQSSPLAQAAIVPKPDCAQFMNAPSGPIGPIRGQFTSVIEYQPP